MADIKQKTTAVLLTIVLGITLLAACSGSGKDPFAEGGTLDASVKTDKASTVGKASRDGYELSLPQGALAEDVTLNMTILSAADSENLAPAGFELLGTPLEVKIQGKDFVRLEQPVSVTIQLSKEQLKDMAKEDVYAAYFYDGQWEYFLPDRINLKKGTATFTHIILASLALADCLKRNRSITSPKRWRSSPGQKK